MIIDRENEERKVEEKYRQKESRKRKRMHVSGKSVFELQRLMQESHGERVRKLKNSRNSGRDGTKSQPRPRPLKKKK